MGAPQIVMGILAVLSVYTVARMNQLQLEIAARAPAGGSTFIHTALMGLLLAWGGFFATFGAPQLVWIAFVIAGVGFRVNAKILASARWAIVPMLIAEMGLYAWGGFFG